MGLGAICCPSGIKHQERPRHGQIKGKKAKGRSQIPGFWGAPLSTDSQPTWTLCSGWLEQIFGSTVDCTMWLILSVRGNMSLSPAWRLFGCCREWKEQPPCLVAASAHSSGWRLGRTLQGFVSWDILFGAAARCSALGWHFSAQPPPWEGPKTGPVATERAKNSNSHGGCRKASEHSASEPASSRGRDRTPSPIPCLADTLWPL